MWQMTNSNKHTGHVAVIGFTAENHAHENGGVLIKHRALKWTSTCNLHDFITSTFYMVLFIEFQEIPHLLE